MMNMGLVDLRLVAPSRRLNQDELRKMALKAITIYEERNEYPTLREAVADCHVVAGTSARRGLYRAHAVSPRQIATDLLAASKQAPVALVFGPEDDGLRNEEIALCTRIVEIPSSDNYRSLNLAQAVVICAYEIFMAMGNYEPVREASPESTIEQREKMLEIWEKSLRNIGFMEEDEASHMMQGVRRIFSRGPLTDRDVRILMGIASQANWVADELRKYRDFS